jgi:glutathione peroxidase
LFLKLFEIELLSLSMNIYDFKINNPQGKEINFKEFEGKVLLLVNTATKCGLAPQFNGLEELHQRYKDKGLVIIGFPCDQFRNQEPESNASMEESCLINFGVSFQLTEKIDVNGSQTHPVFEYLKGELGGCFGNNIKWNFTKFLIDSEGNPVKRYSPITKPSRIESRISKLLKK